MNRRRFLTTSLTAAGAGVLASGARAQTPAKAMPEYYELRQYHLRVTMRQRFSDHFRDEALPAYNRAGIGPIGVFTVVGATLFSLGTQAYILGGRASSLAAQLGPASDAVIL